MTALFLRRRRPIPCRDAVALMSDYLDDRLSARERARLERHLAACPHCTEYLAQLRMTVDLAADAAAAELSDDALEALVDVYRAWRDDLSL